MLPTLIVVSGPAGGYGKTTLAHRIAREIGCPAICRDEIKEGMVHAEGPDSGFVPGPGDRLTARATPTFFVVLEQLIGAGVTIVAEAAFQDKLWRPHLEPLMGSARIRVLLCTLDPTDARERAHHRAATNAAHRAAHGAPSPRSADMDDGPAPAPDYVPISLDVPMLTVDTGGEYDPNLKAILAFANAD